MKYVLLDDNIVEKEKASISLFDRGLLFGDGVFTTLLVENGRPVFFDAHQKRLHEHAKMLQIKAPFISKEKIQLLIEKNEAEKGCFRMKILVTGGTTHLEKRRPGCVFTFLEPFKKKESPLSLGIYPHPLEIPTSRLKTLSYLHRFAILSWAENAGYDDSLVVNAEGFVLEGIFSNLFWIKDSVFCYPDPLLPIMQGITLQMILQIVEKFGIQIKPVREKIENIPKEAALFLTNSLNGFLPIRSINHKPYARDKAFEERLTKAFEEMKKMF